MHPVGTGIINQKGDGAEQPCDGVCSEHHADVAGGAGNQRDIVDANDAPAHKHHHHRDDGVSGFFDYTLVCRKCKDG